MLLNLHVKNLALIKEVDVDFTNGLVVLTGETGAGKSLILGSVNIALGKKVEKDIIRKGAEYALVELTFCIDSRLKEKLEQYDVYPEDENIIVVSRKITYGRSVSKINGETVSLTTLKNVMDLLIDIHGQHDHQSLLYKNTHLQILDKYAGEEVKELKNTISDKYSQYIEIKKELDKFDMDETKRLRECEFAEFEINEIEAANLSLGEDDEVEYEFKKLSGSEKIMSSLSDAYQIMGYEGNQGVCECISRVGYDLSEISDIDSKVEAIGIKELSDKLQVGEVTLKDIIAEIKKPGRDPREEGIKPILRTDVLKIEDITEGMILKGTVRNVVDFGAFVDIGIKNDGLVHKSEMSKGFVKDPMTIVTVGDIVDVKVIGVDMNKKRVALSMKI